MKVCFKVQKSAEETHKNSIWWCYSDHEDGLQVVRAIS